MPGLLFACFFVVWLLACLSLLGPSWAFAQLTLLTVPLLLLGLSTLVARLSIQLPLQNVLMVCALLLIVGAGLQGLNTATGIPFGARSPSDRVGPQLIWVLPLIWATAVFASRGVARLLLRPMGGRNTYGYWVLGCTVLLVVLFELSLEPVATVIAGAWSWAPARIQLDWYGTPWVTFFGWLVSTLLILAFVTPFLISKSPVRHPPDYYPFWIWLLLKALFATAALIHHLWTAAVLNCGETVIVAALVAYNSLSRKRPPAQT